MSLFTPLFASAAPPSRLAIIGGRLEDDNRQIYREMHRLSGGKVLIFPTASSEPEEVGEESRVAFSRHGFTVGVAPLHSENAATLAHDPALIDQINEYGSVYFTGGDQAKILDALIQNGKETPALQALRATLRSGGMLAGSSAGAAMMSEQMILGGTSFEAMAHGVTEDPSTPGIMIGTGLGFFSQGMIDQHFIKRGRLARLVVAMAHSGRRCGFGVDENTALIIEGDTGRIAGEYGVFFVDMRRATIDRANRVYDDIRLSYLDDGDMLDFSTLKSRPGETKRRVRKSEISYRAPARSRRNAFGAYAIYDLVARLVLGDQSTYGADSLKSYDAKSGVSASLEVKRIKGRSRCLVATPTEGLRVTAVNLSASLRSERVPQGFEPDQEIRIARALGMDLNERSRIILLGSSPVYFKPAQQFEFAGLIEGPVGVFAAASFEARRTAEEHVEFFRKLGIEAVDLGVTLDTVDYTARNPEALERIASMNSIFLCGGNQIRLVETLLHRGEESAVLRAIAHAFSHGAALIASSGAASALSGVMIAGGTTSEALRYGVSSDTGHQGIVVREGVGLFSSGIADQNIISARRLGRLVVACVEENERFGIGVCEESGVISAKSGRELKAVGRHGFVQIETDPVKKAPMGDRFMARGVRIRMFGPGDLVNLTSGHIERKAPPAASREIFDRMLLDLERESYDLSGSDGWQRDPSARHALKLAIHREDDVTATLDLEAAREEHDT
jgi:cyanophycinase